MGSARLRGCAVLRDNQVTEGFVQLRGCAVARMRGSSGKYIVL